MYRDDPPLSSYSPPPRLRLLPALCRTSRSSCNCANYRRRIVWVNSRDKRAHRLVEAGSLRRRPALLARRTDLTRRLCRPRPSVSELFVRVIVSECGWRRVSTCLQMHVVKAARRVNIGRTSCITLRTENNCLHTDYWVDHPLSKQVRCAIHLLEHFLTFENYLRWTSDYHWNYILSFEQKKRMSWPTYKFYSRHIKPYIT